ncbi:MAG TPA: hypothetical protein VD788_10525 [Candidatus Polarisedimenticolaceae bacterium]|nr:hypothetical protein [Candidatus Polarisedimenticolaceae bacterium]
MITRAPALWTGILVGTLLIPAAAASESPRLRHVRRYDSAIGKHILSAQIVLDHHALINTTNRVCLLDLSAPGTSCVSQINGLDSTTTTLGPDGYVYVNLARSGFAILHLDDTTLALSLVGEVAETEVFFEKMAVRGNRLYVAAHSAGIRVYDITDPGSPVLVGTLEQGFHDAWDIAVVGSTAYVADGAGGLKLVDLTDETAPRIVAGEDPRTSAGTSQAVLASEDHVYVAAGGAGVAVYDAGDLSSRRRYDTPVCAKNLARVGPYLAVADIGGLELLRVETDGELTSVAGESSKFLHSPAGVALRLWHGVAAWGPDRVLASDWSTLDLYQLVDPSADDQPDIIASTQRLHFPIDGGTRLVTVRNAGSAPLQLSGFSSTHPEFTTQAEAATIQPDDSVDLLIEYSGDGPASGLILVTSNDPDESPLPIQVFGETQHLDIGEPAVPFVLESWTRDHTTGQFAYGTFDLQAHAGQVVFFHVFAPS